MQIYSTMLPVTEELTKDILIELVIEWNQRSPHNKITGLNWDGMTRNIKFEDGKLSLYIEELRAHDIIAIRFHQLDENNVIWTTDIVVDFNKRIFSIKLDRETTAETTGFIPKFKPPVIVTMLLERGFVALDKNLEISSNPIKITQSNYELIERTICRKDVHALPVIYVTKTWGRYPFRVQELAYKLRGVAHVLVEEDPRVANILRDTCEDKNAHHGSIGIYYPSNSASHKILKIGRYEGKEAQLIDRIVTIVCRYVNQQARDKMLTWEGVQNELLQLRYESASKKREKAENEVDEVYSNFDAELEENKKTIEDLNNRIIALQAENQGLRAKLGTMNEIPLLVYGEEEEVYEGEIRDFVLEILEGNLKNVPKDSRKEHILIDVLENNIKSNMLDEKRDKVKKILKGYKKVNEYLRKELQEVGFVVNKDGGHYKLLYNDDPRYLFIMAASGSDSQHGGGNLSAQIISKVL